MIPFDFKIYLASRSPRRAELLRQVGVPFEPLALRERLPRGPDVSETVFPGESPEDYVRRVCRAKVRAAWSRIAERGLIARPVLAADTTVCIDGTLLGKPADRADAVRMLGLLSGKSHRVVTAVAVQEGQRMGDAVSESTVRIRPLDEREIGAYVDSGEPMDKAGAYAIQGIAAVFIAELRGSYSGVMGLPLFETAELLDRIRE